MKQPKADKKEYDEVTLLNPNFICELRTKTLFVWLPHVSAVSGRLMRTAVVRFVDADAVLIADAHFFDDRKRSV